jgi:hypothetical protein
MPIAEENQEVVPMEPVAQVIGSSLVEPENNVEMPQASSLMEDVVNQDEQLP